jgi:WD40-like Beta Propeller Repeat
MYSHRQRNLIGRAGGLGGLPRRQLLQGAAALGFAAVLRPTAAFAESDDEDDERLGPFGSWSTPVNLGPVVNTRFDESHPAISKNGLSLYISSNRPGGVNGANSIGCSEIWVSQRASRDADWGPSENLGPVINIIGYNTGAPNFSTDGHLMFFASDRVGGCGRDDLWVSRRKNKRDDFGWQEPVNLGCTINSPDFDDGPTYFEDEETGIITMYFNSTRPPGDLTHAHIYASTLDDDGSFGPAVLVPELSSPYNEGRTAIRRDGLEMFLSSTRPGGVGGNDIWGSTRETTSDPWSTPVNLGRPVNSEFADGGTALSWDGTTMYIFSNRPGGFGARDLYVTTRRKLRNDEADDEESRHRR